MNGIKNKGDVMKIILNEKALRVLMAQHGIKSYTQLCKESGISYRAFYGGLSRTKSLSKEQFWILADFFDCHIEKLQIPDWTE